jgi:phospholipase/carboxylesterase
MVRVLGLHGSSGHPAAIRAFIESIGLEEDVQCPQGPFADVPALASCDAPALGPADAPALGPAQVQGFTFFRRNADFSIPEESLLGLARDSLEPGGVASLPPGEPPLLVGYSSGAIYATALLAVAPQCFAGAILLRPQVIRDDFIFPPLPSLPVLILSGLHDARRQPHHAPRLANQLEAAGAVVTHHVLDVGHAIDPGGLDMRLARTWLGDAGWG